MPGRSSRLLEIYRKLFDRYGPQHWWPGDTDFEIIIGAILTQATAWNNVEKALANLKNEGIFSPSALRSVSQERLATLLYSCGYFNAKAKKVKAFVTHLGQRHQDDLEAMLVQEHETLRRELLGIYGIGDETADDILLYAAGKPVFVVDAYTRRIFQRLGILKSKLTYRDIQGMTMQGLPRDVRLFNEYHALLVRHGKEVCKKEPLCARCCLLNVCPRGKSKVRTSARS